LNDFSRDAFQDAAAAATLLVVVLEELVVSDPFLLTFSSSVAAKL